MNGQPVNCCRNLFAPIPTDNFLLRRIQRSRKLQQSGFATVSISALVILAVLLLQWAGGRFVLWHECGNEEHLVLNQRPEAVSVAKLFDESDDPAFKSCGKLCFRGLLSSTNRMLFIESFVEVPNPDALSEKRGWYRYEVLKVGDKRCDLFMKSKSARRDFDEVAKGNYGSSGQSSKRCVGATPIEKPTSILIQESRESHWKKTLLGVHVGYTELRNSSSGFIHAKYKSVTYRGSFMYLLATSIYVDGRSTLGCNAPQSLTLQQAESFSPISHLPAISF